MLDSKHALPGLRWICEKAHRHVFVLSSSSSIAGFSCSIRHPAVFLRVSPSSSMAGLWFNHNVASIRSFFLSLLLCVNSSVYTVVGARQGSRPSVHAYEIRAHNYEKATTTTTSTSIGQTPPPRLNPSELRELWHYQMRASETRRARIWCAVRDRATPLPRTISDCGVDRDEAALRGSR